MINILPLALILLVSGVVWLATLGVLLGDGYGHRPPPRSHPTDDFDVTAAREASLH